MVSFIRVPFWAPIFDPQPHVEAVTLPLHQVIAKAKGQALPCLICSIEFQLSVLCAEVSRTDQQAPSHQQHGRTQTPLGRPFGGVPLFVGCLFIETQRQSVATWDEPARGAGVCPRFAAQAFAAVLLAIDGLTPNAPLFPHSLRSCTLYFLVRQSWWHLLFCANPLRK